MPESGGPANQAGVLFQNTIAALFLGRMLDMRPRARHDRVLHLRVEAPTSVDDMVVRLGDHSRRFVQAKRSIDTSSDAWLGMWAQVRDQLVDPSILDEDRIILAFGEHSPTVVALRECCLRTRGVVDLAEYMGRATDYQRLTLDKIEAAFGGAISSDKILKILSRVDVEIYPYTTIERDFAPLWMPDSSVDPTALLSILRDIVGGESRVRGDFSAAPLLERLRAEHGVAIAEPEGWGIASYRAVMTDKCTIEVPGTGLVKPLDDTFVWPRARRYDRARRPDFDDEVPTSSYGVSPDRVDLSQFPSVSLHRLIVVAGQGLGKSTLITALVKSSLSRGLLPAVVRIPDLSRSDATLSEYLRGPLNTEFDVAIDWAVAADAGILVLFLDGLDEVSSDRRAVVLERIKIFSSRHPRVSWLLTVRDVAALAAPTDALRVELESLHPDDVGRFISFYGESGAAVADRVRNAAEARPDLARLIRIPFFLALLLASGLSADDMPFKRTELLEAYLELLFRPEQFKQVEPREVDPNSLRSLAEVVAYEALEREEIGVDARRLERSIRKVRGAEASPLLVIERLVACGVLRRMGPVHFTFPYPVIQEYLAACHILEHRVGEIENRLIGTTRRPWVQAMQFVLEKHPDPAELLERFLAREDDAFGTGLRLVARCAANGMGITTKLRSEISRRLSELWRSMGWPLQERIGSLIGEVFSVPLLPELRAVLSDRHMLHAGAGAIVTQIGDPGLTKEVLLDLLAGDIENLLNLSELQIAVNDLGDETLDIYEERARRDGATDRDQCAIASLIGHLDAGKLSRERLLAIGQSEDLSLPIRLEAFGHLATPADDQVLSLVEAGLAISDYFNRSAAVEVIARFDDPIPALKSALMRSDLTEKDKLEIVGYLPRKLPDSRKLDVLRSLASDMHIEEFLRRRLLTFAARYGDRDAMSSLIESAAGVPIEDLKAVVSIFGHHPSRALAEKIVRHLEGRSLSAMDRAALSGNVVLGMTSVFQMDCFLGGGIEPAPLHPGADLFRPLLEDWATMQDYDLEQALIVAENLVQLGSRAALATTEQRLKAIIASNEVDLRDHMVAARIGGALRTLRERQHLLSLTFLESVVARCSYNGASGAVQMIAAHGSQPALDMLLSVYESYAYHNLRNVILGVLEPLAGRLGVRIRQVDGELDAAAVG